MIIDYRNFDVKPIQQNRKKDFQELRLIFNKVDPMRFFRVKGIAPVNEYDPEIASILIQMQEANDINAMHDLIYREFANWFDPKVIGPKESYYVLAQKLLKWQSANKSKNRSLRSKLLGLFFA